MGWASGGADAHGEVIELMAKIKVGGRGMAMVYHWRDGDLCVLDFSVFDRFFAETSSFLLRKFERFKGFN